MTREEASYILRKFYADGYKSNNYNTLEQALKIAVICIENRPHWISVEFPHWISVEEEPKINPNDSEWEYSDDVIVALKDGSIAVGRYERDNSTGEHYWVLYGIDKDLVVTHWMPMPSVEHLRETTKMIEKGGEK